MNPSWFVSTKLKNSVFLIRKVSHLSCIQYFYVYRNAYNLYHVKVNTNEFI